MKPVTQMPRVPKRIVNEADLYAPKRTLCRCGEGVAVLQKALYRFLNTGEPYKLRECNMCKRFSVVRF